MDGLCVLVGASCSLTKQCTLSLALSHELLRSHVPLPEGCSAVLDAEGSNIAVPVEPRIIFNEGRQLRIGHDPIKDAIDLLGDLTVYFQLRYISFHATGLHEPRKLRAIGKVRSHLGHLRCE